MSRKYWIFIKSKKTFDIAKNFLKLTYVWDTLRGAGWTTTVELNREQLVSLRVKLWNCKYQLLKIRKS